MTVGVLAAAVPAASAAGPRITARAAVIMDARTGDLLWSRDPDRRLPPASTTKVMTAVLALESGKLGDRVSTSRTASVTAPRKLSLRPGQQLVLKDLVYAILLNSANDASVVIAEKLSGSVAAFGRRMTAKAHALGAGNTQFRNPHGLTEQGHYSSARDQALIMRYALDVPHLRGILSTRSIVVEGANPYRRIALHSHNRLLQQYRVPVIGKTGYTRAAKKCYVAAVRDGDRELIVALLGSNDLWGDARQLIDYGLGLPEGTREATRAAASASRRTIPKAPASRPVVPDRPPVYAIHVGTFDRMDRAERLRRGLDRRGFAARIDSVATGSGAGRRTRYRVEIGPYTDRGQAESALRQMAQQVALPTRIVRR